MERQVKRKRRKKVWIDGNKLVEIDGNRMVDYELNGNGYSAKLNKFIENREKLLEEENNKSAANKKDKK